MNKIIKNGRKFRTMPNIFEYFDYRQFIRDFYKERKRDNKRFSYQAFAMKAGFRSKSSLANIACCNYALTKKKIHDVAAAMGLNKKETEYFESMVGFSDAKTTGEREFHFTRMRQLLRKTSLAKLTQSQYEFYSKWYNCVIRELVTLKGFDGDYRKLAKMVEPSIKQNEAKKAVELLQSLGMIKKMPSGAYRQKDTFISTGDEVTSLALRRFHKEHLRLAAEAIERQPRDLRNIGAVTVGISKDKYELIIRELSLFRKRILEICADSKPIECIYQVAMQLYPVSKPPKKWKSKNGEKK